MLFKNYRKIGPASLFSFSSFDRALGIYGTGFGISHSLFFLVVGGFARAVLIKASYTNCRFDSEVGKHGC